MRRVVRLVARRRDEVTVDARRDLPGEFRHEVGVAGILDLVERFLDDLPYLLPEVGDVRAAQQTGERDAQMAAPLAFGGDQHAFPHRAGFAIDDADVVEAALERGALLEVLVFENLDRRTIAKHFEPARAAHRRRALA